jgi:small nuclear ribonucleoprotein (snRNP)-like protein
MPLTRPKSAERPAVAVVPPTAALEDPDFFGQRRLIRPALAALNAAARPSIMHNHNAPLTARGMASTPGHDESSHAEAFYFQKQIQAQTRIIVVLENGSQLEGTIEWYDRYAIKLRAVSPGAAAESNGNGNHSVPGRNRVLIYKDCIRYIYKAGENAPQTMT